MPEERHDRIQFFTGSVETGEKVRRSATSSGKRVTLELGGKNARCIFLLCKTILMPMW
ncbi:aldehyde dehydrogenase family protein [Salmonella enterica subsp. enterica serovar Enteritidis]|nr:aldehyde dehydrogenase family protein [Salmonella enterica subsp. enterica serovar Enteritidis]